MQRCVEGLWPELVSERWEVVQVSSATTAESLLKVLGRKGQSGEGGWKAETFLCEVSGPVNLASCLVPGLFRPIPSA